MDRAVYYASRWAIGSGGGVVMLRIIATEDQNQHGCGSQDIVRAEAHEEADARSIARRAANGHRRDYARERDPRGRPTDQNPRVSDNGRRYRDDVLAANPGAGRPRPDHRHMAKTVGRSRFPSPSYPAFGDAELDACRRLDSSFPRNAGTH